MLRQWLETFPAFIRYWVLTIFFVGIATKCKWALPYTLVFLPQRAVVEPWRFLTAFCWFGDMSVELLFQCYTVLHQVSAYEGAFAMPALIEPLVAWLFRPQQRTTLSSLYQKNQTADFVWFAIQIAFLIVVIAISFPNLRHWEFLGRNLQDVMVYLALWQRPDEEVFILGLFRVKLSYIPIIHLLYRLLFSRDFMMKFLNGLVAPKSLLTLLYDDLVLLIIMAGALSHAWWYVRHYLPENVYLNVTDSRDSTYKRYGLNSETGSKRILRWLLLPPWYYFFCFQIANMATHEEDEDEVHENFQSTDIEEVPAVNGVDDNLRRRRPVNDQGHPAWQ